MTRSGWRGSAGGRAIPIAGRSLLLGVSGLAACATQRPSPFPRVTQAVVERVAPGVVSTGNVFGAAVTPDGAGLYFVRVTEPGHPVIMFSRRVGEAWGPPAPTPFTGSARDIDPFLADGGRRLYFNSDRPRPGDSMARRDFDIWFVDRTLSGWGPPQHLPLGVNSDASDYFATLTSAGTIHFSRSVAVDGGMRDVIFRADRAGRSFGPSTLVGPPVNDGHSNNNNPLIAPDGSWMVFSSDRSGGFGRFDLYLARRTSDGWSQPQNLGPLINTEGWEFAPALTPDGRGLLFTRRTREADGSLVSDVYLAPFPRD